MGQCWVWYLLDHQSVAQTWSHDILVSGSTNCDISYPRITYNNSSLTGLWMISQSIKRLSHQYPWWSQAQWRDSQISVQQQNRGHSSITSTGQRACRYLWGKGQSKRCVFRCFLKEATEMAELTDRGRLFQRDGTAIVVWSQWTGWKWCGKHGVKINRLFFTQGFVGQQIDLKQYSRPYWQPMKGTKQWKTVSK